MQDGGDHQTIGRGEVDHLDAAHPGAHDGAADAAGRRHDPEAVDVAGLAELIRPLERSGALLPRTREQLELDIGTFTVMVRDGTVIACNALIEHPLEGTAEFACVAVHPDYRGRDLAAVLLRRARERARARGFRRLVALTTQTPHWFIEHGFQRGTPADLPPARRSAYDPTRNSIVLVDSLDGRLGR